MSRFNNLNAVFGPPRGAAGVATPTLPSAPLKTPPVNRPGGAKAASSPILKINPADNTIGQRIGFLVLCLYLVSGYANEFTYRTFGVKSYLSTVCLAMLPVTLIVSGNLFRGMRDTIGRLWVAMILWMALAIPFSVWKGGSVRLWLDYASHDWIFLLIIAAFAISVKHCRWLMHLMIGTNVLLLVYCALAGGFKDGRLEIPHSVFFRNANDLSLQLTLAIAQFLYLLFQPGVWPRVLAVLGSCIALIYDLQTGSRAGAIALVLLAVVIFFLGKQKLLMGAMAVVAVGGALAVVPSAAFHRISLLSETDPVQDRQDLEALGSRAQRVALLKQSIEYTVTHPLFGVGPGQFAVAADGDAAKDGKSSAWLGTHNSYTEISSECGIPAFVMYVAVVMICLWSNLRLYLRSRNQPRLVEVTALAFATFCACWVFAVATFFYHVAYTHFLPQLGGMTVALRLATDKSLWGARRTQAIAGSPPVAAGGQFSRGVA